jgi:uncharacterized protein YbjT (DUF2867 family)
MILVTGGTGFIGKSLVRSLVEAGNPVRLLIRPSPNSPDLPKGVPVEVAISGLRDERGLRAALVGINVIYHLASAEGKGPQASMMDVDIKGTQALVEAARESSIDRFYYVSHLDSDRASAFPVLKAKAIAEEYIRRSGLTYTILRSALVYGPGDSFTTGLARLLHTLPILFLVPGNGKTMLQPLWIEDLVTCLMWSLDYPQTKNQTYEIGGPEYLSFQEILNLLMEKLRIYRSLVYIRPPYMRALTVYLENLFPRLPVSVYWLDYMASNHTCPLDTLPKEFNLMPARFSQQLDYLCEKTWRESLLKSFIKRSPA